MITNNDITRFLGLEESEREFEIKCVDSFSWNRKNTLMFNINKILNRSENPDYLLTRDCITLVPTGSVDPLSDYSEIIPVDNPKYTFCRIVERFNLKSKLQREFIQYRSNRKILRRYKNVLSCKECYLGDNVQIDPGAIIGGTDFSPVLGDDPNILVQFPQLGGVIIGDNVVIKYNTMVGKGTFGFTYIGENTMIDFGCQVGHNCIIGDSCIIAAGTIIGGSTTIGDRTVIGIGAKIRNGIKIGKDVSIGMGAVVINDVSDNAVVVGNPARVIEHKKIFDEGGLK